MDGLLIIDKPQGLTSHDVVSRARRLLGIKRIGHFGTLDPMATGVLILAVGKTTRLFDHYRDRVKRYEGVARLGWSTDSYDATGQIQGEKNDVNLDLIDLNSIITPFLGEIEQLPPIYSAKKKDGRPLYHYARRKIAVDIKSAQVTIYDMQWRIEDKDRFWFSVSTSSGAYIRSLVHDIGQSIGCGGHLASLRRTAIGEFSLERAMTLEQLAERSGDISRTTAWEPMDALLPEWPKLIVSENGARLARNGNSIPASMVDQLTPGSIENRYRIFDQSGCFIGLAGREQQGENIKPFLVLA